MPFAKGLSSYSDEHLGYRKEIPVNHFVEHVLCWSLGDCIDHRIQEELRHATETRELLDEFCSQADQRSRRRA
ncbi:hypothetical protein BS47DRAFT_1352687 [Hydnum rufescens UP504]|uniref:Uncharacterized protein n=1 Tax=Hydnum rufescens UP504 TaxID=1448309 RepID=A0A9P6DQC7_9AGAM|nr:hypothetical protein BS47DRAFT_1352687 [Hydnum rufescens UP504]